MIQRETLHIIILEMIWKNEDTKILQHIVSHFWMSSLRHLAYEYIKDIIVNYLGTL